jgi:HTH-like domain
VYKVIVFLSVEYSIRTLCLVLSVCFSSFYAWKRGESYTLSIEKMNRSERVKKVFEEHRRRYGALRVSKELQAQGLRIGRHQTTTLMKAQGLVAIKMWKTSILKDLNGTFFMYKKVCGEIDTPQY